MSGSAFFVKRLTFFTPIPFKYFHGIVNLEMENAAVFSKHFAVESCWKRNFWWSFDLYENLLHLYTSWTEELPGFLNFSFPASPKSQNKVLFALKRSGAEKNDIFIICKEISKFGFLINIFDFQASSEKKAWVRCEAAEYFVDRVLAKQRGKFKFIGVKDSKLVQIN